MSLEPIAPDPFSPTARIDASTDLAQYFVRCSKPASRWMIGPEVELFGFTRAGLARINASQVQEIIAGFSSTMIDPVIEDGYITEATLLKSGADGEARSLWGRLTLEPGGQVEFSGAPHKSLAALERMLRDFISKLRAVGDEQDIVFISIGFDPIRGIREQEWVPKQRYNIMRPYLATRGNRGWDMMSRTAATQVNLDYSDTEDLIKKFTLANRLGPVAAAIFANSPFEDGKLSGYKTLRYAMWLDTDPDRTGPTPLALEDDFSIERFLNYIFEVPMMFVRRAGDHIDYAGHSFREFITGCKCPEEPIFQDFTDHLTTLFTEARLKPHIEQRSMDCGSIEWAMAALSFWKGLMYDRETLDRALQIMPRMNKSEFTELQVEVARHGLEARARNVRVIELAQAAVRLARSGLQSLAPDEARYLDVLDQYVERERICPADILIRNFLGSWNGQIRKVIDYLQIA